MLMIRFSFSPRFRSSRARSRRGARLRENCFSRHKAWRGKKCLSSGAPHYVSDRRDVLLQQNEAHMKTLSYIYLIALLLPALIINEQIVQWVLAVRVGSYSVAGGFQDAFKYFSVFGYLFFTAFRLVPYVGLGMILIVLSKTRFKDYVPSVFVGGLVGVLAMVVWGSWMALLPLYTGAHVSSTTAISFLFIPVYAVPTGAIAALVSAALYTPFRHIFRKGKAEPSAGGNAAPPSSSA